MNKIILATRIAQWWNPMDMFLKAALGSKYIHSELIFNCVPEISYSETRHAGRHSFSSRGRVRYVSPRKKGVRFATVNYNKGRWIYTPLARVTSHVSVVEVHKRCQLILGKDYDSLGAVFNAGFRLPIDKAHEFWCSEACAFAIMKLYPELTSDNVTPERLLRVAREECGF